jgi:hypothetical protein
MPILIVWPGLITAQPNLSVEHTAGSAADGADVAAIVASDVATPGAAVVAAGAIVGADVAVEPVLGTDVFTGGWVASCVAAGVQANSSILAMTSTEKILKNRLDISSILLIEHFKL